MQAEGIRRGDRGEGWEALEDAVVGPNGRDVSVMVRTADGRTNRAHYVVGEQVPLTFGAGPQPRFPKGTPEYAQYSTRLHEELEKFTRGEPPYDQPIEGYPGAARDAGFGL